MELNHVNPAINQDGVPVYESLLQYRGGPDFRPSDLQLHQVDLAPKQLIFLVAHLDLSILSNRQTFLFGCT
jgi:hypothetical protein